MEKQEPTNGEILETVNNVLHAVAAYAESTEQTLHGMKSDITSIKSTMATKDYIDRKISDLRADLVGTVRRVDEKDSALVEVLKKKNVISKGDRDDLISMSPLPRLA